MRKEAKLLKDKAINSLVVSIEHFNRPIDRGRAEVVLIMLDHSFEMLLKAAILHRGGKIREPRARQTIGFDSCVRKALNDGKVKFLTDEQALTLQNINSLRDAAQHHLIDISEQHLYIQAQAGLTLFRDIYKNVFGEELHTELPARVLPLSTSPPMDLATLFDNEVKEIERLLSPGSRRNIEAKAKLRSLAIMENSIQGEKVQPGEAELRKIAKEVKDGKNWSEIFPGVALLNITTEGYGPSIDLRFTKQAGVPMHVVPEGTPGAAVIGIKRVDDLGFYNLGRDQLATNIGLSGPKTTAVIRYLDLQSDPECYKRLVIGRAKFDRYSQKAILRIQEALTTVSVDDIWQTHGIRPKKR
ncbi:MAG: hypothetical protein M1455_07450 [Actinobacteria bacterium]|nr:hypothetical protein [Actinomycetota bacterium]